MSESYILHDVMRKVKADGLFDSIRRDLIADLEQKSSYLDLKSNIESLMSSYLSEHKWSSTLKKSELRERARRHIETSSLIKDTLPSIVSQYMQTCQQQLVQPRLSSFVSDHIEYVYNSIGGTHVYRPSSSYTQTIPTQQETEEKQSQSTVPIKKEPISTKAKVATHSTNKNPQTPNLVKKKPSQPSSIITQQLPPPAAKKKPLTIQTNPIKEEKKSRNLSPLHSPNDLVDISPSPPITISLSPSPPPPIVRIASPLTRPSNTEKDNISPTKTPRKIRRSEETNDESTTTYIKKKKMRTEEEKTSTSMEDVIPSSSETDTRRLRARRPNPKYSKEQFETDSDLMILEPLSPPTNPKPKKLRQFKSSTSFEQEKEDHHHHHHHLDTPSSPPPSSAQIETSLSIGDMSPEYRTSLPSPTIENQQNEVNDEQSRTPSPVTVNSKRSTSPRRLRPRKANEKYAIGDNLAEKTTDLLSHTSSKSRESVRRPIVLVDDNDFQQTTTTTKRTRYPSSSGGDTNSNELPNRSISVPDNLNTTAEESQTPVTAPISKSFIWKPKISK